MDQWRPRLEQAELRRLSPLLRRLLVYGDYGRAWRALGFQGEPWVSASNLDVMLREIDRELLVLAFAPPSGAVKRELERGYTVRFAMPDKAPSGSQFTILPGYHDGQGFVVVRRPDPDAEPDFRAALENRVVRGLSLSAWLRSPAAVITGKEVSRQNVITYVANKLGGAHFDANRGVRRARPPLFSSSTFRRSVRRRVALRYRLHLLNF